MTRQQVIAMILLLWMVAGLAVSFWLLWVAPIFGITVLIWVTGWGVIADRWWLS